MSPATDSAEPQLDTEKDRPAWERRSGWRRLFSGEGFAAPSAMIAGFLSVLIGITSAAAIVLTAARTVGADPTEQASWMLALGLGMGVTCIGLSIWCRVPVVTAWSTPGAALLANGLHGLTMAQAVSVFLVSAALTAVCGITGVLERIMNRLPLALASALLAGVLLKFGVSLFTSMGADVVVVLPMFIAYLALRWWRPRYAVVAALVVGAVAVAVRGGPRTSVSFALARPEFVAPVFSWQAILGVAIPLFVVTMTSQNLPGVAVLKDAGYIAPVSRAVATTGIATLLLAPFGCFALNLAAITAAICTGRDAHPLPERRFVAACWAGVFYIVVGLFGGVVVALLLVVPQSFLLGIAGIGLLPTMTGSLTSALRGDALRESAIVTFLTTASGMSYLGIGSAFWGLVLGVFTALATGSWRALTGREQTA